LRKIGADGVQRVMSELSLTAAKPGKMLITNFKLPYFVRFESLQDASLIGLRFHIS
jgi:hypothetical protein